MTFNAYSSVVVLSRLSFSSCK